jgi:hypothetical protein
VYIEDLIQKLTNSGPFLFTYPQLSIAFNNRDNGLLNSFAEQIDRGNALTEKQGRLAELILKKYADSIRRSIPDIDKILSSCVWKNPFRVLPKIKKISIADQKIFVEFPFDNSLVELMREKNNHVSNLHKGIWEPDVKKWVYYLNEQNILWLGDTLLSLDFSVDEDFVNYYRQVSEIRSNIEQHLPMLSYQDNQFRIINAHKNVPQPETDVLAKELFTARQYGITVWDDSIESRISLELDGVTKQLLSHNDRDHLWVDSRIKPIESFRNLLLYGSPVMIIIPGGSELESVVQWTTFAMSLDIPVEQISVMFRLPNDKADFNNFVKDYGFNNPVDENTKIVFLSTKVTKPLIKSGIRFNTVINLGYYNYMHFTMSTVVENTCNLVYYSMKEPTTKRKWQPQE